MKWIGQHIWDFISRFRSKIYLEDIDNAGSDTDAFLVKKADGEVAIRTGAEVLSDIGGASSSSDVTGITVAGDTGSASDTAGNLDISIVGGEGIDTSAVSSTITIAGEDASTANKGIASFSTANFAVSSGNVTIKAGGVDLTDEVSGTLPVANGGTGETNLGNVTVGTATNASHVSVADNESEDENNLIPFIEDASATGNVGLESDGDFHYNPSDGRVTSTQIKTKARIFETPSTIHFDYAGDVIVTPAAGSTTQGNLVYMRTNGTWADAAAGSAASSTTILGIALGANNAAGVLLRGTYTLNSVASDIGNDQGVPLYVSTAAGKITAVAPSGSGDIVRVVGYNLGDDDEMWFDPSGSWVEIA